MGTSSPSWAHLPLHGHIFPFMATYSTSLAHLPLHWHIFLFIGTSSPSWVHLPFKDTWRGALAGHGLLPRELSRGFRRDTRGTLSEKCPIRFMPHLHTLSLRGETSKTDPRFAYADCLREDYREASARCLRVPTRTCKYQCFRFRGVNMSSPHKKVPSFQKKTWLICTKDRSQTVVFGHTNYAFLGLIYGDNRFDFRGIHIAVMTVYGCLMVKIDMFSALR